MSDNDEVRAARGPGDTNPYGTRRIARVPFERLESKASVDRWLERVRERLNATRTRLPASEILPHLRRPYRGRVLR